MGETRLPRTTPRSCRFADPARGTYARSSIRDGRLVGAILLGDDRRSGTLTQLFDRGGAAAGATGRAAVPAAGGRRRGADSPVRDARRGDGVPVQQRHQGPRSGRAGRPAPGTWPRWPPRPGPRPAAAAAGTRSSGIVGWLVGELLDRTVASETEPVPSEEGDRWQSSSKARHRRGGRRRHGRAPARRGAARTATARSTVADHGARRGAPARLRPGGADLLLLRQRAPQDLTYPASRSGVDAAALRRARSPRSTAQRRTVTTARRPRRAVRRAGAGHRFLPVRAAGPGQGRGRAASSTGPIDDLDAIREAAGRADDRRASSAAGCSAWRPPARCGGSACDPHRGVRAAADAAAGRRGRRRACLRNHVEALGLSVHTDAGVQESSRARTGGSRACSSRTVRRSTARSWSSPPGIRPRDELARAGRAGGRRARRRSPSTTAAAPATRRLRGRRVRLHRRHGLRAGRRRATRWPRSPPTGCSAARRSSPGADMSTKLKLLGVDVAQLRRRIGPARSNVTYTDPVGGVYKKLVRQRRRPDPARRDLVGDAVAVRHPAALRRPGRCPARPASCCSDRRPGERRTCRTTRRSARCNNVTKGQSVRGHRRRRLHRRGRDQGVHAGRHQLRSAACRCSKQILVESPGVEVSQGAVRALRATRGPSCSTSSGCGASRTFSELIAEHGTGPGLRHLQAGRRLDPRLARQRARPRRRAGRPAGHQRPLPGQHPAQRHLLGRAAHPRRRDHPGQADRDRRGGPRLRPLHQDHRRAADRPVRRPRRAAARDLEAAGRRRVRVRPRVRQGAAHGEVLRRAPPGAATACRTPWAWPSTWSCATGACARRTSSSRPSPAVPASAPRPGARTSASSPPSRAGTSTSAATAGSRPRHADLLAADLSTEELIRTIDRFLMFYIRTADRLQRTAAWLERLDGGLDHVREVIVDDSLGICAELDAAMAAARRHLRRRVAARPSTIRRSWRGSSPSSTRREPPTRRSPS